MAIIVFKPKSSADHKEGTVVVQAPRATGWGESNYVINDYVSNLPTTGSINSAYSGRFDDTAYYTT